MFNKKIKITILDTKWESIKTDLMVYVLPQINELIYIEEYDKYFEVIRTIHMLNKKNQISYFVIINDFTFQLNK